jgi:hypothetical protein
MKFLTKKARHVVEGIHAYNPRHSRGRNRESYGLGHQRQKVTEIPSQQISEAWWYRIWQGSQNVMSMFKLCMIMTSILWADSALLVLKKQAAIS